MALSKLVFKPGVNRDQTNYASEGGWYETQLVRFRSGYPEKFGGWTVSNITPYSGSARSVFSWSATDGSNLLGVGTNTNVYVGSGTTLYNITPIFATYTSATTPSSSNCIATTNGSKTVTVTITGHGATTGTSVLFSGISGPTIGAKLEQTVDNSIGDWVIDGADDSLLLQERLAYPSPTIADVTAQLVSSDDRTGYAETVIKGYVEDNISLYAGTTRAITYLDIENDLGRGSLVTAQARFNTLQELCYNLATTGGIGYTIEQNGALLEFQVYQPQDLSGTIRMDLENGKLSRTEYSYLSPKVTRAIVGGSGEGEARIFYEGTTTGSITAEGQWGRRIETFIDNRQTAVNADLAQKANEALVENGLTIVNTSVTPSDDVNMRYGFDWGLGDLVTVVIGDIETSAVVTEVGVSIEADGVRIGATVGTPAPVEFESKIVVRQQVLDERISHLERNEPDLTALVTKQYVNNRTGSTLSKGQVVYINGAQGNRVTVALARADAEMTSSTTFGVVEDDILNNQSGYVITQGSLAGLDTSSFTEGAALWLSPSIAGSYSTTKPTAPNHLVLVGYVERSQSVNGSIFVKIANGYELDELHSVLITSPTEGQVLTYEGASSLWKNKGGAQLAPITKTSAFTVADTETNIIVNGVASVTVTLPTASTNTGRSITIKTIAAFTVVSASSNVVPLTSATAGTAILAATAGKWATLVSNGTNWVIMAGN